MQKDRVVKGYGWWIAIIALIAAAVGYMFYDEPLEPEAQAWLDAVSQQREGESVAHELLLGLDAGPQADPRELGRQRLAAYAEAGPLTEPAAETGERLPRLPAEVLCGADGAEFFAWFRQNPASAQALLDEHRLRLQRYREVLALGDFRSQAMSGPAEPLPAYFVAVEGNRLQGLEALLLALQGNAAVARQLLEDDIRQLRGQLAQADNLIGKMIWINLLSADLDLLARLRAEGLVAILQPLPQLSLAERDMQKPLQREFANKSLGFSMLESQARMQDNYPALQLALFFKPRQSINLVFAQDRPLLELAQRDAATFAEQVAQGPLWKPLRIWQRPNNPMGVILANVSSPDMRPYLARVHDLDAQLRLFNLLARLPAGQSPDQAWLSAQYDAQNPYLPGRLPNWSAQTGRLCYVGPLGEASRRCIQAARPTR